jgi:antitoxin VapB
MPQGFRTRQFVAGNSAAVRIPANMAFPPKTELLVTREGNTIKVEPLMPTLRDVPQLFAQLGKFHSGQRPEFEDVERKW